MCIENASEHSLLRIYGRINRLYYEINTPDFLTDGDEDKKCKDFINDCFVKGQKDGLLDFDFRESYLGNGKHLHTVLLYLLGTAFIEENSLIKNSLERQLRTFLPEYDKWYNVKDNDKNYDFLYTWYLTALYHDVASCVENIRIPENPTERQKDLEYYLGELDVVYSPYGNFPYRKLRTPQRFSENLIKNYFYYRANKGSCEHGILAGYLFFDRFVKNFLRYSRNKKIIKKGFIEEAGNLKWHIEQLSHAAYAADAIICHNIWMGGEMDTELYQAYGLSPLLYLKHGENKLSIQKYPLQFMLCLLDTIEPAKRFAKKLNDEIYYPTPRDVLKDVKLEFKENGLEVSWKRNISEQPEFEYWKNALKDLKNWMDVRCEAMNMDMGIAISWNTN